jgi:IMP dehydrogenase
MGSGTICITQEQKGTGRGLATAIIDVVAARDRHRSLTGQYVPVIADGGVVTAKDMVIALALGADCVMMGRYFARMDESPAEKIVFNGRMMKAYWGEGSARAREWKAARYGQATFVEGVEGLVDYAGKLADNLPETLAMVRSSMASCGVADIHALHQNAELELVSALSIREGQVHDVVLPRSGGVDDSPRTWGD